MEKTTEQHVADVILQHADTKIEVGGITYEIAPATPATLIMVSALVSTFPKMNAAAKDILGEVMRVAKDMTIIGEIAATLILGAKRIKENRSVRIVAGYKRKWSWWRFRVIDRPVYKRVNELEHLTWVLLNDVSTDELGKIINTRLGQDMQVGSFFALTAFLSAINLIRPTREAEATACGE